MIEPTTVWMVHLDRGPKDEIEGTLTSDDDGLVLTGEPSGEIARFAFADVINVKRVFGSPVFTLAWRGDRDGERRETAFYLNRPPPLGRLSRTGTEPEAPDLTLASQWRRTGRWRQRRDNTRYLSRSAANLKHARDALVGEIRAAAKAARGEGP